MISHKSKGKLPSVRCLLAGTAGALLLSASAAFAGPIALPSGGVVAKIQGVEELDPSADSTGTANNGAQSTATGAENNWGVFQITDLYSGTAFANQAVTAGSAFFTPTAGSGPQIMGMFYGIQTTTVGAPTLARYGVLDLYYWAHNTETETSLQNEGIAGRTAENQYSGVSCGATAPAGDSGCVFLAQLDLVPGDNPNDPNATVYDATDPTALAGSAYFQAEVDKSVVGAWTSILANNYFLYGNTSTDPSRVALTDPSDLNGQDDTSLCSTVIVSCPKWATDPGSFGISFQDPEQLYVTPEPASIALFGAGLLGFCVFYRRRQKRLDSVKG